VENRHRLALNRLTLILNDDHIVPAPLKVNPLVALDAKHREVHSKFSISQTCPYARKTDHQVLNSWLIAAPRYTPCPPRPDVPADLSQQKRKRRRAPYGEEPEYGCHDIKSWNGKNTPEINPRDIRSESLRPSQHKLAAHLMMRPIMMQSRRWRTPGHQKLHFQSRHRILVRTSPLRWVKTSKE